MATPISTALLDRFAVIFIVIFLFAILYGLLEVVHLFGDDKKNLHAAIAAMIALLAILSADLIFMIKTMLPWISLMIVFFFFMHAIPMFMGLKQDEIITFMGGQKRIATVGWVFGAMLFIVLYALGTMYGNPLLNEDTSGNYTGNETASGDNAFFGNAFSIVFNAKVIGLFVFMLIATLAIQFLTRD